MPRFFVTPTAVADGVIFITGDDARHIARSLRMAVGDSVTVADGSGTEYECTLARIRDEECECHVTDTRPCLSEPPYALTLYMAYPKSDKLETVQEATVKIAVLKPSFMSVTYGAGGGTSEFTLSIAQNIQQKYGVPALAHLTCVNSTREEVAARLEMLKKSGMPAFCPTTRLINAPPKDWDILSTTNTPGITGLPGKCPLK